MIQLGTEYNLETRVEWQAVISHISTGSKFIQVIARYLSGARPLSEPYHSESSIKI